jgi:hypothetical protein
MKFKKLLQVQRDDLVYRTITAFEAPSAVVGAAHEGDFVTPSTFPVFKMDRGRLLPEYMRLLTTWPQFHQEMASRCTGTVLRRKTLSVGAFSSIPVSLPPLGEQRRIVALIETLDNAGAAAGVSRDTAQKMLAQLRQLSPAAETTPLGALAQMRSGPSWAASDQASVPSAGATPVLGITNTPPGQVLDLEERKFVTGLAASVQRLTDDSIVMIRTNGNRNRIGNVYRATPEVEGFAVSAFQIAIEPHNGDDADFLYWYLGSPDVQASITQSASGSTGLGNVAIGWLKRLPVPVLENGDRQEYVDRCAAAGQVLNALIAQEDKLRDVRSNLLTVLLSGEHEIPDTYDELLAG